MSQEEKSSAKDAFLLLTQKISSTITGVSMEPPQYNGGHLVFESENSLPIPVLCPGLKEIFREKEIIAPEASLQEMKYLLRLEAGRKRYRWRKRPSIIEWKEWQKTRKKTDPYSNLSMEEILALLARKAEEQSGGSE